MVKATKSLVEQLFMVMLAVLLFYPPFFRGLYFEHEFLYSSVLTVLVFAVFYFGVYSNQKGIGTTVNPLNLIDLGFVLLIAAYTISTLFVAVNVRASIGELMKLIYYLLVYFMISRSIKDVRNLNGYLTVLYFAGLFVALVGLGSLFGTFNASGAVFGNSRIASTFQYPNTLAVYLTAILVIGYYLQSIAQKQAYRYAFAGGNYLLMLAFWGTESRGGVLVMVPMLFLFTVMVPKGYKLLNLLTIGGSVIASMAVASTALSPDPKTGAGEHWLFLGVGLLLAIMLQAIIEAVNKHKEKIYARKKIFIAAALAASVMLVFAAVLLADGAAIKVFDRLSNISLQDRNVLERGFFYKDALKIIADHPVLGIGGGGWAAVSETYKSYNYATKFTHNYYLQTWVEAGVPGVAALLVIWIGVGLAFWRLTRNTNSLPENRLLCVTLTIAALSIGMHSIIDFNMSFAAIGILFWVLLAGLRSLEKDDGREKQAVGKEKQVAGRQWQQAAKIAVVLGLALFLVLSASFRLGLKHANLAVDFTKAENIEKAKSEFELALKYDPLNPAYKANLANIYYKLALATRNPATMNLAYNQVDRAIKLNAMHEKYYGVRANIYLANQEYGKGLKDLETARKLGPWNQEHYDALSETYKNVGMFYLEKGQKAEARKYLTEAAKISKRITAQQALLTPAARKLWQSGGYAPLQESATIKKNYVEAIVLLAQL